MWVITMFTRDNIKLYEFSTETEARDAMRRMDGRMILSEVIYYNDPSFVF